MREINLDEIKKLELELLIVFDKFCKKNNLYYTLAGGTLLGAVRHKGFIPWDDDVDVMMPRPDFERLLNDDNLDYSDIKSYMRFASWRNEPMPSPTMKLVDTRTKVSAHYTDESLINNQIWLDIFVLDGNPADDNENIKLHKRAHRITKLNVYKSIKIGTGKSWYKKLLKPIIRAFLTPFSFKMLCDRADAIAKTYDFDEAEYCGVTACGYGPGERVHKKEFMTPIEGDFEGFKFNIPSNYDEYLSGLYHDYMKLPPEEKRVTHELTAFIED